MSTGVAGGRDRYEATRHVESVRSRLEGRDLGESFDTCCTCTHDAEYPQQHLGPPRSPQDLQFGGFLNDQAAGMWDLGR